MKGTDMRTEMGRGLAYMLKDLDSLTSLLRPFLEVRGVDIAGKRTSASSLNVSTTL